MKSLPKLIRRFVGILLLSIVFLILLNIVTFMVIVSDQDNNARPWTTALETADALLETENGYILPDDRSAELSASHVWGILIDNSSLQVIWHTDTLPDTVPMQYTASDIAGLTRGYIDGYPTFTGQSEKGLMVLGYPKDSFWKHMWPSWDYYSIKNLPRTVLYVLAVNIAAIFLIYMIANARLLKSVKPIAEGIQALPEGEAVRISEKGLLSELAANINRTSDILQSQNYQLRKKETARANWIAGVSHDIRTPLSMVMGYAGQLKDQKQLPCDAREKANVILRQSRRIKNLINDLNLASKLEYNMQPIHLKKENAVAVVRQVIVDFINEDIDGKYPIIWETADNLNACMIQADSDLLKRAVSNLIQNSINHNENGCTIFVSVDTDRDHCMIRVDDDGIGASDEQLDTLNHIPHYLVCDKSTTSQRHGLGLLIVKQIAASHNGKTTLGHSSHGGFSVKIILPAISGSPKVS